MINLKSAILFISFILMSVNAYATAHIGKSTYGVCNVTYTTTDSVLITASTQASNFPNVTDDGYSFIYTGTVNYRYQYYIYNYQYAVSASNCGNSTTPCWYLAHYDPMVAIAPEHLPTVVSYADTSAVLATVDTQTCSILQSCASKTGQVNYDLQNFNSSSPLSGGTACYDDCQQSSEILWTDCIGSSCIASVKYTATGQPCGVETSVDNLQTDHPDRCTDQINEKIQQCGGSLNVLSFDFESCTGECTPDACADQWKNLVDKCGGVMAKLALGMLPLVPVLVQAILCLMSNNQIQKLFLKMSPMKQRQILMVLPKSPRSLFIM